MAKPPSMSRGRDPKSRQKYVEQVYEINWNQKIYN
jgi:hypothetical protein